MLHERTPTFVYQKWAARDFVRNILRLRPTRELRHIAKCTLSPGSGFSATYKDRAPSHAWDALREPNQRGNRCGEL